MKSGKTSLLNIAAIWTVVSIVWLSGTAQSESRYDIHNDLVAPGAVEYSGRIDRLSPEVPAEGDHLSIGDTLYTLDENVILRNKTGNRIAISSLADGMYVNFYVKDGMLITKLWISDNEEDADTEVERDLDVTPDSGGAGAESGGLRFEDGVWKN